MELRHLRYFVAVAECLNFTVAAEHLHMSQPPLSQQIMQLEAELGTLLLSRTRRRVALTEAGVAFLEQARAILSQVDRAVTLTRAIGAGRLGTLDIGLTGAVLLGGLGRVVAGYRGRFPDIPVRLHEMPPHAQEAALIAGSIDVCFLRTPSRDGGFHSEIVWREAVGVALPRNHRLAGQRRLALGDLRGERFVFFRRADSWFARYLWSCCIEAGFEPDIAQEVVEAPSLIGLVTDGFGLALLPESARRLLPPELVFRPLAAPAPRADVAMAYRPDHTAVVAGFLDFARAFLGAV